MIKDNKHSLLAFASVWLIVLTCIATDIFYLRNTVLLISAIPITAMITFAMLRTYRVPKKPNG